MQGSKIFQVRLVCVLCFASTVLTFIAVPIIFTSSNERSDAFWLKVAWSIFLSVVGWSGVYGFLSSASEPGKENAGRAAIAPGLMIDAIFYATASLLLLLVQSFYGGGALANRLLWAAQAGLTGLCAVVGLLVGLGRTYATANKTGTATSDETNKEKF